MRYQAVNACIRFVGQLDGCQLLTVEDLKSQDGAPHPVQQAMVECHASQCGFCTPGFVMSLFALYQNDPKADHSDTALSPSGSTTRSPAISAAAPATRRSSRPRTACCS